MVKLPLTLITQKKGSYDCGLICAEMIANEVVGGDGDHRVNIGKEIHVYKGIGTFLPQIGCYFLKRNCSVELLGLNPYLFSKSDIRSDQETCKNRINQVYEKLIKKSKSIKRYKDFMENGGIVTPSLITSQLLEEAVDNGKYIVVNLTDGWLYNTEYARYNFHYVCVSGYDECCFLVHDPLAEERGVGPYTSIKKEELLYAIYAAAYGDVNNACCLFITKS